MITETPIRFILSYYEGHDANFTIYDMVRDKFFIINLPVLLQEKHVWPKYYDISTVRIFCDYLISSIRALGIKKIDMVLCHNIRYSYMIIKNVQNDAIFKNAIYQEYPMLHHKMHLWCGLGQSNFKKAVIMTHDGEGDGECFNLYAYDGKIRRKKFLNVRNGMAYHAFALLAVTLWNAKKERSKIRALDSIKKRKRLTQFPEKLPLNYHYAELLDHAGKGMGMAGFEEPPEKIKKKLIRKWNDHIEELDELFKKDISLEEGMSLHDQYRMKLMQVLIDEKPDILEASEDRRKTYAKHIMWVAQKMLEESAFYYIEKHKNMIQEYDNNLVIVGGVGLNVILNQKIKERYPHFNVYVPPNPDDSGLSLGVMLSYLNENNIEYNKNLLYSGMPFMVEDIEMLIAASRKTSIEEISNLLAEGKIIAIMQDRHEIGPRALGNRSILADPKFTDMKDTINKKVKFREEYRPFAPVCRKEDAPIYFDSPDYENMEAMSYCPKIRPEYKDTFPSIVHVDDTCRLQTVTKEASPFLYDLLTVHPTDVLLNTSFNVAGKPICNSMTDALSILEDTGLDYLVYKIGKDHYIIS